MDSQEPTDSGVLGPQHLFQQPMELQWLDPQKGSLKHSHRHTHKKFSNPLLSEMVLPIDN